LRENFILSIYKSGNIKGSGRYIKTWNNSFDNVFAIAESDA